MSGFSHTPIMLEETVKLLAPERGGTFIDGTLGGGGHAYAVLAALDGKGVLYGIDRDGEAIAAASERLAEFADGGAFAALRGNFFDMRRLLAQRGVEKADGILLDLGVSSYQLDTPERGFSYHDDAPLDMRMDKDAPLSAYDVVNGYDADRLADVIRKYGEERFAGRVARAIAAARPVETTAQLASVIKAAIPAATRRDGPHPARRTFQAIRIEVNGELDGLEDALQDAHDLLDHDGVLAVITFHSLEDRVVKQAFKRFENPCTCDPKAPMCTCGKTPTVKILTRKPIVPSEKELQENPRARSAKLRAVQKL